MSRLIKWEKGGLKTPLSRAKGLGSAKSGLDHWMMQRITAISNLMLGLWFLITLICAGSMEYTEAVTWISSPLNAVLMILLIISTFYHAVLGSQVVIEDYVHGEGTKLVMLIGQKLIFFGMAVACIFSILQIAL